MLNGYDGLNKLQDESIKWPAPPLENMASEEQLEKIKRQITFLRPPTMSLPGEPEGTVEHPFNYTESRKQEFLALNPSIQERRDFFHSLAAEQVRIVLDQLPGGSPRIELYLTKYKFADGKTLFDGRTPWEMKELLKLVALNGECLDLEDRAYLVALAHAIKGAEFAELQYKVVTAGRYFYWNSKARHFTIKEAGYEFPSIEALVSVPTTDRSNNLGFRQRQFCLAIIETYDVETCTAADIAEFYKEPRTEWTRRGLEKQISKALNERAKPKWAKDQEGIEKAKKWLVANPYLKDQVRKG